MSVYFTALAHGSGFWPQVTVSLTFAILVAFTLGSLYWVDGSRAFGVGFAISAWLYFLLVFADFVGLRQVLVTHTAVEWIYQKLHVSTIPAGMVPVQETRIINGRPVVSVRYVAQPQSVTPYPVLQSVPPSNSPGEWPVLASSSYAVGTAAPRPAKAVLVDPHSFANIAHALWTLIVGAAGGLVAHIFVSVHGLWP